MDTFDAIENASIVTLVEVPTMYAVTKTGAIKVCTIVIQRQGNTHSYTVTTGNYKGKMTSKKHIVKVGKQTRNVYQQTVFECDSKVKELQDDGYKTLELLKEHFGIEKVEDLKGRIKYNTDVNNRILPMLALKLKDQKDFDYNNKIAQPKLNGLRCRMFVNYCKSEEGFESLSVVLVSRGGIVLKLHHISKAILLKLYGLTHDVIIDGELYHHGTPLQEIQSLCTKETVESEKICFVAYDIAYYGFGINTKSQQSFVMEQSLRLNLLKQLIGSNSIKQIIDNYSPIMKLPNKVINSLEELKELFNITIEFRFEGLMIRDRNGIYEGGYRSKHLLKYKPIMKTSVTIIGSVKKTNIEDFTWLVELENGLTFEIKLHGTVEERYAHYKNRDVMVGKKLLITHHDETRDNIPTAITKIEYL